MKNFKMLLLLSALALIVAGCSRSEAKSGAPQPTVATASSVSTTAPASKAAGAVKVNRLRPAGGPASARIAVVPGHEASGGAKAPEAATAAAAPVILAAPGAPPKGSKAAAQIAPALVASIGGAAKPVVSAAEQAEPDVIELGAGNLAGLVLAPGVYAWSSGVSIPGDVTLAGGPDDVWVFQIAQDLVVSNGASVLLSGGARADHVSWYVAGRATLGRGSMVEGTLVSKSLSTTLPAVALSRR